MISSTLCSAGTFALALHKVFTVEQLPITFLLSKTIAELYPAYSSSSTGGAAAGPWPQTQNRYFHVYLPGGVLPGFYSGEIQVPILGTYHPLSGLISTGGPFTGPLTSSHFGSPVMELTPGQA